MTQDSSKARLICDLHEERVTIVVGTGISVSATDNQQIDGCSVATWPGLLLHGVEHCRQIGLADEFDVNVLTMQIKSKRTEHIISAAETITNKLRSRSPGVYRGWLKQTIGALQVTNRSTIEALSQLPGIIATLNYDNLIEDVTGRRAITWLKADEVEEILTGRYEDAVIHLHGWYREPESVVLGTSSYINVKDHSHAKSVLQHFTIGRTLLFVGCGATFEDPNFNQLIQWGKEAIADVSPRHYVLCRSSEMAQLQIMLQSAPWLQPLAYGETYECLNPFLQSLVEKKPLKKKPIDSKLDLEAYRKAMLVRYKRLKIEQLDPTTHDIRPLTLNALYIDQHAKECTAIVPRVFELPKELQNQLRRKGELEGTEFDDATLAQYRRAYLDGAPRLVSDIFGDSSCTKVVILGDPGSGKSTLLQHEILQWADVGVNEKRAASLPLLIELREFARYAKQNGSDNFLAYLHNGAGIRWHLDQEALAQWLRAENSLILFDGLDEIFDLSQRREITTAIHRFSHQYPLARIVVTSRVVGYQHQAWNDEGFRQFMLQDLDQEKIEVFLSRWHKAAYDDIDDGEKKRLLLEGAIKDSAAIRQLAGNPLLLTMMAVLNRTQDLPRDRAELYEQCARLLLHQWKIDVAFQTDPDLANASLDFKDKRGLLLRVARAMHSGERGLAGNLIDEEVLESTLAAGLNEIRVSLPDRAARSLIDQLRGRNFMLCFMGGRSYAFVHRTFLEYFCALEIRERFEKERSLSIEQLKSEIFAHWGDETWHEVLCLLAGMISAKFAEQTIQWLIKQPDPNATQHHFFVALRCLGEIRNRTAAVQTEADLRRIAKYLSVFESPFDAPPWTEDGQLVIDIRKKALKTISAVWPDERDNSRWFRHIALADNSWDVPETAIRLLVEEWRDDCDTFIWLKDQVTAKGSNFARVAAIEEIARNWKETPETRSAIMVAFRKDRDESTRASALQAIAEIDGNNDEIVDFLLQLAQKDKSYYVSYMAMQILVNKWKENEKIFPTLFAMVRSIQPLQRHLGLQVLVRHWTKNSDVIALLQEVLEKEEDPTVLNLASILAFEAFADRSSAFSLACRIALGDGELHRRQQSIDLLVAEGKDDPKTLEVIKACAADEMPPRIRSHAIGKMTAWAGDEEVFKFLKLCLSFKSPEKVRKAALQSLAQAWGSFDEVRDLLFYMAKNDKSVEVRKAAVEEIANSNYTGKIKIGFLLEILRDRNIDPHVRVVAIKNIAQYLVVDARIFEDLVAMLSPQENLAVRFAAIGILIRNCSSRPETLPLLKKVLLTDRNADVRLPVVVELSRRANEDSQILGMLKISLKQDRSKLIRMRLIKELTRRWGSDADVIDRVIERKEADSSREVRDLAEVELKNLRLMA